MEEYQGYIFCKKHFKMNYQSMKDAWCKVPKDAIAKNHCGMRSEIVGFCKNKVYAEFYPNLLELARASKGYGIQRR